MAQRSDRITAPELQQFVVVGVQLTGRVLGTGAYGTVEEAAIPGATVAAKKLHPQLINLGSAQQVRKWMSDFVEECKLMSRLRHPSIVQFLGICYVEGSQLPMLLMEKLQTSLDSLLETTPNIPQDAKVHLLLGTASGVVYLHAHDPPVIHRDLTARNVLIDSGLNAKIADLGVARIVTIRPGQLAATMTGGPGNNLYMPPEASPDEDIARYGTSIDIFSFGVIELFTLTQLFPSRLKPANYRDPVSRKLVARSEIERREDYVTKMKSDLGENHPLVGLTLECLAYDQEDRPSAEDILQRLEEVRRTIPQNCTETKLELIQRIADKDRQVADSQRQLADKDRQSAEQQAASERHQAEVAEKQGQMEQLLTSNQHLVTELSENQIHVNQLQAANDRLQAEKTELQRRMERQIEELSREVQQLRLQPQAKVDVISAENSTVSVDPLQTFMVGREATADLQVMTSSNRPHRHNVTVTCELVRVKSGRTFVGRVTKKAVNKHTFSFTPTHRGRHTLRVCVNSQTVRDHTLLVAPDPASLRKPTRVISELNSPYRITTNDKCHIIVSEFGVNRVSIFGLDGTKIRSFGSKGTGNGQFNNPRGITVDGRGCIYVADCHNHRIQKFSPDGEFLASAGTKGSGNLQFKYPPSVHYNRTTDTLYVVDMSNHRIQVLTSDLTFHSMFGREGSGDGKLSRPAGVCCDEVGNVYVTEWDNHRVQVFTAEGVFVCTFGSHGSGPGQLNRPMGITVSSGLVYVSEYLGHRVSVFTLTGEFIGLFGGHGYSKGHFDSPTDVTVIEDRVIVADGLNSRVQIF